MFSLLAEAGGRQSANTRERASASREFLVVLRHGILGYLLEFFGHIALKLKETPKNKRRSFDETTLRESLFNMTRGGEMKILKLEA